MKRRDVLPALSLPETRVRLLAWSFRDAELGGTMDGGGADANSSRVMAHGDLWYEGSFPELERAMGQVRGFVALYVDKRLADQPRGAQELREVTAIVGRTVYVPSEVSEAAGYGLAEAKAYTMPRGERMRRWACRPTGSLRSLTGGRSLP